MPLKDPQLRANYEKARRKKQKEERKNNPDKQNEYSTLRRNQRAAAKEREAAAAAPARDPHGIESTIAPFASFSIASTNDSTATAADNHLHAVSAKDTSVRGVTHLLDALALTLPPLASTTPNEMSLGTMEAFVTAFERAKEVMSQFDFSES